MLGLSKCGKCENTAFKIQEMSPQGVAHKLYTVGRTKCQTLIGIMDYGVLQSWTISEGPGEEDRGDGAEAFLDSELCESNCPGNE
jgi:hypothetical protein